jgi:hypothetical protein
MDEKYSSSKFQVKFIENADGVTNTRMNKNTAK